ncbi:MAG: SO_0444 family Cu/Zn efflux transporter [Bacteroidaceae bacterium]|nr:SO_0444 family Cu/Zn efflux transporter [Bacteroidaceae bacterium]
MNEIIQLITSMSPYLLLGFLIAGIMHTFIPGKYFHKYLSKKSFRSVINAALIGIPLPLCSCGVIPTAMSMRKDGASKGAVTSFLIATPQTGVDSIMATFSLMGLPFAIIRPIAALFTAVAGGFLVNKGDKCCQGNEETSSCCCHSHSHAEEHSCQCHSHAEEPTCQCHSHSEEHTCHCHKSFLSKVKDALTYAYVDMVEDIGKWLVVGLVIAGIITTVIPTEYFAFFKDNTLASMLLVLLISMPMYLCATGSIPIAVALMMKGLTPGAALVLLVAGPACNFASILILRKFLGTRTLLLYLGSIVFGSIIFGCLVDWLQFAGHVDFLRQLHVSHACCDHGPSLFNWACTILLALMLINALLLPKLGLRKKKCCCH